MKYIFCLLMLGACDMEAETPKARLERKIQRIEYDDASCFIVFSNVYGGEAVAMACIPKAHR